MNSTLKQKIKNFLSKVKNLKITIKLFETVTLQHKNKLSTMCVYVLQGFPLNNSINHFVTFLLSPVKTKVKCYVGTINSYILFTTPRNFPLVKFCTVESENSLINCFSSRENG